MTETGIVDKIDVKKTKVVNDILPVSLENVEEELTELIGQNSINPYFSGMTKGYKQEATIDGLNYWYDKGVLMGIMLKENPTIVGELWQAEIDKLTIIAGMLEE